MRATSLVCAVLLLSSVGIAKPRTAKSKATPPPQVSKPRVLSRGVSLVELTVPSSVPLDHVTSFDVSPKNILLLLAGGKIISPLDGKNILPNPDESLDAFAFRGDDGILTSHDGKLGYLSEKGIVDKLTVPSPGFKLLPFGSDRVLVWGGREAGPDRADYLYLYQGNGTYMKWAETPAPIRAVTTGASNEQIFLAVGGAVFETGSELHPKVSLMISEPITSLSFWHAASDYLFFTTKNGIYVSSKKFVVPLLTGVDCQAKMTHGAWLMAICPSAKKIYRLTFNFDDVEKLFTTTSASTDPPKETTSPETLESLIAALENKIALSPKEASPYCQRAEAQRTLGRLSEALDSATQCFRLLPEAPARDQALSRMVSIARDMDPQMKPPAEDLALLKSADVPLKATQFEAAEKIIQQVIDRSPWYLPAYRALAYVYVADKEDEKAWQALAPFEKNVPTAQAQDAHYWLGNMIFIRHKHGLRATP